MMLKIVPAVMLMMLAGPASAQIGLPTLGGATGDIGAVLDRGMEPVRSVSRPVSALARDRVSRLTAYVRQNRNEVELDEERQPARRGEILLLDPDTSAIGTARAEGYGLLEHAELEGLGIAYARLAVPDGVDLATAIKQLRRALPEKTVTADQLHFTSANGRGEARSQAAKPNPYPLRPRGGTVGIIDGGITTKTRVAAQRGFAKGAPVASEHAIAIASLLSGAGIDRLWAADVYGNDPAGGNALAIAQALGWMVKEHVPVVSIILVGPSNPLLARAVAAARAKGTVVVAAVGNDGSAAPPAYPASYPGVIAVTGVDGRRRVLIEAGNALNLDYAAPGADLTAVDSKGARVKLRGTSYAAPLVAARFAAHRKAGLQGSALVAASDAEASAAGRSRPSRRYGRGILCGSCRQGI